jgi:hypothetical protein
MTLLQEDSGYTSIGALLLSSTLPDDMWSLMVNHERHLSIHVSMASLLASL